MTRIRIYWLLQIVCWGIYILYASIGIVYFQPNSLEILGAGFINFIVFLSLTHLYRLKIRKKRIESLRIQNFLFFPIIGNILIAIVVCIMNNTLLHFGQIFSSKHQPTSVYYLLQFLDTFRYAMPWFIFYHGIKFAESAMRNEKGKLEAQMQLKIAELENLKNQLNPHFLFNALNSIRSLTLTDPMMARDATTKLSDLLRISLTYKDLQDIPFEEELNLVKDYLSLEKIRFEHRLNYSFDISKGTLKALVPPMSLQLLAENAVKHGVGKDKLGGQLTIYSCKKGNSLVFGVKNTGSIVISPENVSKRQGIGLENLKKRLELNYGIKDGFEISETDKIVTSQVSIPIRMK